MGKSQKQPKQAKPADDPVAVHSPSVESAQPSGAPSVVRLTAESVAAGGKRCPAGTIISPNVEGWPAHRVHVHLRDGKAELVPAE